jgi:hypothetical protein
MANNNATKIVENYFKNLCEFQEIMKIMPIFWKYTIYSEIPNPNYEGNLFSGTLENKFSGCCV